MIKRLRIRSEGAGERTRRSPAPIPQAVQRRLFAVLLLVPAVAVIGSVILYPLLAAVWMSVHQVQLAGGASPFVGLRNYQTLFTDPVLAPAFWSAVGNTFYYTLGSTLAAFLIGSVAALLLHGRLKARGFFRGMFMLPWVIPWVSTSLLFMWMFDPTWGIINDLLERLHIVPRYVAWFGQAQTVMPAFIVMNVWKLVPFMTVMLMAGLQSLSGEQVEAAHIDGARYHQLLRHIIFPHLRPVIAAVTLISIIWGFQAFTPMWIITQGGPEGATTTLAIFLYKEAFENFDFGIATAIGTVWLIFLIIFSFIWIRLIARNPQEIS